LQCAINSNHLDGTVSAGVTWMMDHHGSSLYRPYAMWLPLIRQSIHISDRRPTNARWNRDVASLHDVEFISGRNAKRRIQKHTHTHTHTWRSQLYNDQDRRRVSI